MPEKSLQMSDPKNRNYLEAWLQKFFHFSSFIASVDGLMGINSEAMPKCLSSRLATKWNQPYLQTWDYVHIGDIIAIV